MNTSTFQMEYISISECIMAVCKINGTFVTTDWSVIIVVDAYYHCHHNQPAINDALTVMSCAYVIQVQQSEEESHAANKNNQPVY